MNVKKQRFTDNSTYPLSQQVRDVSWSTVVSTLGLALQ